MISFFKKIFTKQELMESSNKGVVEEAASKKVYSIDELIESLKEPGLKLNDVKLNEGATDEVIISTQNKLKFIFPADFISFYKQANGFADWGNIGNMFSIWPLERILQEYDKSDDKNFIPFCDHCIDCYRIGYFKSETGVFKDFYQIEPIAMTFEDTIRLIIEDSALLY